MRLQSASEAEVLVGISPWISVWKVVDRLCCPGGICSCSKMFAFKSLRYERGERCKSEQWSNVLVRI